MTDVTQILCQIEQGDPSAAELLLPLVYEELRKLAAEKLAHEKPGQTLQATALVHDAYIRLVDVEKAIVHSLQLIRKTCCTSAWNALSITFEGSAAGLHWVEEQPVEWFPRINARDHAELLYDLRGDPNGTKILSRCWLSRPPLPHWVSCKTHRRW